MPSGKIDCFLDSNILLYAAAAKKDEPRKFAISYELVLNRNFGVSGQTLAEFCSVARRKRLLDDRTLDDWLGNLGELPLVAVDQTLVRAGLMMARRFQVSYYDAALLAAAERLGAPVFFTEDLNHNQLYGAVRAVNPFLEH